MTLPGSARAFVGLLVLCGCGGTEPEPVVTTVTIEPATATVELGSTVTLAAQVHDQRDNLLGGRPIAWTSQNVSIASVGANGIVTGMRTGQTRVVATVDGKSAQATVLVTALPVASVAIINIPTIFVAGQTAILSAVLSDRLGNSIGGRLVEWTSSDPSVATIDYTGLVRAVALGTTTITARSDGVSTSSLLAVTLPGAAPVLVGVAPATLQPGQSATIDGTGFDPGLARNVVTVGGEPATVTAASATQLVITVPCVQSGPSEIRVTTNGATALPAVATVAVTQRALAVGQATVLGGGGQSSCIELPATGTARYVVSVFSASTSANSMVDFELSGNRTVGSEVAQRIMPLPAVAAAPRSAAERAQADRDAAHFAVLERDRAWYERTRAAASRLPSQRRAWLPTPLPTLGEMRGFFFTLTAGCADTSRVVRGKAIYVGSRAIIWEDSTNTLQSANDGQLAGYYERLGRIFDTDQYDVIRETFGDPLRRDPATDADGRIHMVFTNRLSGTGAAAYVTSCDQQPRTIAPGSNFGEYFYGAVPTTSGSNLASTNFPDGWFYFMARTVVHEVKHIASMAARVANDAPTMEQSWLEEGTARHAEEVWVRRSLHQVPWKGNTGWGGASSNGLYCDFHPENETCNAADALRRPSYGMRRQFNELRDKLLQPASWSPYGDGSGQSGSVFYQTAWSLVRYAIDRYGASDAAFLGALTDARVSGTANLATVAGVPMDQLLGAWTLALYLDDHPLLANATPDLQFATWNLRSIYAGLNADPTWAGRWPTPFPIQPTPISFGAFGVQQLGLRGGASAYYELSGSMTRPQLLRMRSASGSAVSNNVRLAIARLQ